MLNVYNDIKMTPGLYTAGFYKINIIAREWLDEKIEPDFSTGIVTAAPVLKAGRTWIQIDFTPDTYEFEEKPKESKSGPFFEVSIQGLINTLTPELLMALHTIRNHEVVAVLHDKKKRLKVVGNIDNGLVFRFSDKEDNSQGGRNIIAIDMNMDSEYAAPFYATP